MERWKQIDQQEKQERLDRDFNNNLQKAQEEATARTEKNRKKRQRQKEAKLRKKNLQLSGVAAAVVASQMKADEKKQDDDEFAYTPISVQQQVQQEVDEDSKPAAIQNDGSFLERMKAQMAAESESKEIVKTETKDDEEPPLKRQAT